MKLYRRTGLWGAALAMALGGAAGCADDKTDDKTPPGVGGPAYQLSEGNAYRRAWGTPNLDVVLALSNLNPQTKIGTLEMLAKGKPPVTLSGATDANVKVSTTSPAAALFLENIGGNSVGSLQRSDFITGEKKGLPSASQVFAEGFWFGPTSDRVLFISEPDEKVEYGKLYWSNLETSDLVGVDVYPRGVVFSKDRKAAIVAVDVSGQTGKLLHLDLTTGTPRPVGEDVVVFKSQKPAFSISDDGSAVAYASSSGAVMLWKNGSAQQVASSGVLPGISADGSVVAFGANGKLVVAPAGGSAVELSAPEGDIVVELPPIISDDKGYVAWFSKLIFNEGLVGDAWVAPTTTSAAPVKIGTAVAVDLLKFSGTPSTLVAVAELKRGGVENYKRGYGQVLVGNPAEPLTTVAKAVFSDSVGTFVESGRVAAIGGIEAGKNIGVVKVSPATPGADVVELGTNALPGTLAVASNYDRVIYLVQEKINDRVTLEDGTPFGTLYGSKPDGKSRKLEDGVVFAGIDQGGRAITVVGTGTRAGVWSHPLELK